MGAGAIVTPEAVRLEFEAAGLASRALSRLVDTVAVLVGLFVAFIVLGVIGAFAGSEVAIVVFVLVTVFLAAFGYPALAETWFGGRTLGKLVTGLRVVTVEGGPVRFRHAAIRSMFQLVDFILVPPGAVAVGSALVTRRTQRVGDLVAGTFVVRERQGVLDAWAVPFPPPWGFETYVASLDPSVLAPEDYRRIRAFLLRSAELAHGARARLALALAQPLAERLRHRPPPQVSPETFLYCLAASYQQRFGGPVGSMGLQPPPPLVMPPPPPPPRPAGG